MKKALILMALVAMTSRAALNPHPVQRVRMTETDFEVVYKDKLSDGSYRDSQVKKPKMPEYPERITLIATNDAPRFWELVYEAVYESGRRSTNYTSVLKDKRDIIKDQLTVPPVPQMPTNAPARTDAFGHAKNRILAEYSPTIGTNKIMRMEKMHPRVLSSKVNGKKVVHKMSDGTERTETLRVAHTARTDQRPKKEIPEPVGKSATFLLGFAAGVAAMGGAVAVKKGAVKK